jgi:hypothetical protein
MPLFYTYQKDIHRKQAFFIHIKKTYIENTPFNSGGFFRNDPKLALTQASINVNKLIISHLQGNNSKSQFFVFVIHFSVFKISSTWKHQVSKKTI